MGISNINKDERLIKSISTHLNYFGLPNCQTSIIIFNHLFAFKMWLVPNMISKYAKIDLTNDEPGSTLKHHQGTPF